MVGRSFLLVSEKNLLAEEKNLLAEISFVNTKHCPRWEKGLVAIRETGLLQVDVIIPFVTVWTLDGDASAAEEIPAERRPASRPL